MQADSEHRRNLRQRKAAAIRERQATAPRTTLRQCLRCRYDLKGMANGKCPECAWPYNEHMFMLEVWNTKEVPGWGSPLKATFMIAIAMIWGLILLRFGGDSPCFAVPLGVMGFLAFAALAVNHIRKYLLLLRGTTDHMLFAARRSISVRRGLSIFKQCRWHEIERMMLTTQQPGWWRLRLWTGKAKQPHIDVTFQAQRIIATDVLREIRQRRRRARNGARLTQR